MVNHNENVRCVFFFFSFLSFMRYSFPLVNRIVLKKG